MGVFAVFGSVLVWVCPRVGLSRVGLSPYVSIPVCVYPRAAPTACAG